ncbi:MAG TPA: hypothetical protein VF498_12385, partial [Anaerolineales bacterium]
VTRVTLLVAGAVTRIGNRSGMGHLLVADPEASAIRAISLGEQARVFSLVGAGLFDFGDVDGAGREVRLQHPAALAFAGGMVYITDTYNNKIKKLDPTTGQVETLIGTGQAGYADGLFEQASLYEPEGIAVVDHLLFIADTDNHRIRVADLRWRTVSTLSLTGLEKLRSARTGPEPAGRRLEPVKIAPGLVEITLGIQLPPGHHLNTEIPSRWSGAAATRVGKSSAWPGTGAACARAGGVRSSSPWRSKSSLIRSSTAMNSSASISPGCAPTISPFGSITTTVGQARML